MKTVAPGSNTIKTAEAAIDAKKKRTFTGDNIELLKALNADSRVTGPAFKVVFCIINHVNEKTGTAWPSVQTISIKTRLPVRVVERALRLLREIGWLASERIFDRRSRKTHNIYRLLTGNLGAITDEQVMLLDAAKASRTDGRRSLASPKRVEGNPPPAADRSGGQSASSGGSRSASSGGLTPKGEHPNSISASKKKVLVVEAEVETSKHRWPALPDDHDDLGPDRRCDDGPLDEDAWRLRVTGSDDRPPRSRSEIIAQAREIAQQHALEHRAVWGDNLSEAFGAEDDGGFCDIEAFDFGAIQHGFRRSTWPPMPETAS
ncbi:helix-turn-helix domain-containing protein [Bradyrhizobium sp. GCM10023182]|uniref:Helix-turn-helix domain-containing protein n=1 Tax=Bradyrhizobium zhengyangense TaxID=2911009 RepID=A0ABS9LE90_9BRAD|nr:helix-turn-helix domain-containing protein [Bradyrhizobium zhengyangense]MCG2665319.1 helix-turn-helix domain-containing protein [Bradyrhizobium zhengyangense]